MRANSYSAMRVTYRSLTLISDRFSGNCPLQFHFIVLKGPQVRKVLLYPDSGISMDEETVLGDVIWSYNKVEL